MPYFTRLRAEELAFATRQKPFLLGMMIEDMITVNVLFFAHYQDVVRSPEQRRVLAQGATVGDLAAALAEEYEGLASLLSYARVAVNMEPAEATTLLHEGDEVALMPPMSGG